MVSNSKKADFLFLPNIFTILYIFTVVIDACYQGNLDGQHKKHQVDILSQGQILLA